MDEIKEMTQYLFQTKNRLSLVTPTAVCGVIETIICYLLVGGDLLVIAFGGTWGERVLDMALRYGRYYLRYLETFTHLSRIRRPPSHKTPR
mgnify:CR=1 FL=1